MGNYYQPEIETMPVEKLQALQSERLVEQVKYVYDHVEFYRNKMKEAGVEPEDIKGIEDLHKLPFVTKDDLRDQYPYGFLGVPLSECDKNAVYKWYNRPPCCCLLHTRRY